MKHTQLVREGFRAANRAGVLMYTLRRGSARSDGFYAMFYKCCTVVVLFADEEKASVIQDLEIERLRSAEVPLIVSNDIYEFTDFVDSWVEDT